MAKHKQELNWQEIDPATLIAEGKTAYAAYKAQYAKAAESRKAFEAILIKAAGLPDTHTLVFGYNFGKLSAAVAVKEEKSSAGRKAVAFNTLTV